MKILEVIPSLQSAGAERLVVELSNELDQRDGIQVTILQLYPFNNSDLLKPFVSDNIAIYSLNKPMGASLSCFYKLYKFIKEGRFDVVHTHTSATRYLLLTSLIFRSPVYCSTIHSDAKREAGGFPYSVIKKILYKFKLCIPVTISEESNKSYINYYHQNAPIIYNGIKRRCNTLPVRKKERKIIKNTF